MFTVEKTFHFVNAQNMKGPFVCLHVLRLFMNACFYVDVSVCAHARACQRVHVNEWLHWVPRMSHVCARIRNICLLSAHAKRTRVCDTRICKPFHITLNKSLYARDTHTHKYMNLTDTHKISMQTYTQTLTQIPLCKQSGHFSCSKLESPQWYV